MFDIFSKAFLLLYERTIFKRRVPGRAGRGEAGHLGLSRDHPLQTRGGADMAPWHPILRTFY